MLKGIWEYRYFILNSIITEFKSRFIRSKLGAMWMILNPLAQVLIYALVLSAVLKAKLPGIDSQYAYAIYLLAGMVGWSLFVEIVGRSLNVFIENGNLIKKVSFPKLALPLIIIGSSLINYFLLFISMLVIFAFLGHVSLDAIFWIPLLIIITLVLAIGIGLLLGTLNVFIRDIGQIMGIFLQFWFWLTPVVYSLTMVPEKYHNLFFINPVSGIVVSYHDVLVYNRSPNIELLLYPTIIGLVFFALAWFLYSKANEEMADVL